MDKELPKDRLGVKPHKAFLRVTKSNLPGSASYKANLVNRETVGMEELAAHAVARSCSYSQETLIAAYRILKEELYDALRRGLNVDFEFGRIEMGVSGAFRSALDPFDPERNQLVANLRPSPRLRQLAASIPAENMTTDFFPNSPQPAYVSLRIEPRTAESDEPYNQLPAGTHKHVSVYGRRLRLMGDHPDVGIRLRSLESGEEHFYPAADILVNTSSRLCFVPGFPLTAGEWELTVYSQFTPTYHLYQQPRYGTLAFTVYDETP